MRAIIAASKLLLLSLSSFVLNYTTLISGIILGDKKANMSELCKQRLALGQRVDKINRLCQTCQKSKMRRSMLPTQTKNLAPNRKAAVSEKLLVFSGGGVF